MFEQYKKDFAKYKKKSLDEKPSRQHANFVWRKRYKQALWIFFGFGALCIIFGEFIVGIFMSIANITFAEKMSGVILYGTALIIFWYTRETYDLKQGQRKEFHEVKKQTDYEMRPYLRLQWSTNNDNLFQIVNDGRGIAIDVRFKKLKLYDQNLENIFKFKSRPSIRPNGFSDITLIELWSGAYEGILEQGHANIKSYFETWINHGFDITVTYKDIEDRNYTVIFAADKTYNDWFKIKEQKLN